MGLADIGSNLVGGIVALVVVMLLAFFGLRRMRGGAGARERWARSVKFSGSQLTAMRSLWQWYRTSNRPSGESLALLSSTEIADLIQKCDLSYMPKRLQLSGEEQARAKMMRELKALGMNEMEQQIVVGMKFARLGPAR